MDRKPKLLIITQIISNNGRENAALLFFMNWLCEFAHQCEQVTVICLYKGKYELPPNVKVLSLGKERGVSQLKYIFRFYKYIWTERKNYDSVFVHMNQIYVILGGLFWRSRGNKIGLWYVHKQVTTQLKIAEKIVNVIITAAKESFNVPGKKVHILGHGIDTNAFIKNDRILPFLNFPENILKLVSVGRVSPIKDLLTMTKALGILKKKNIVLTSKFIGPVIGENDEKYKSEVTKIASELNVLENIEFTGSLPENQKLEAMWNADISVNLCPTGGLDKAVIESICAGAHTFIANEAYRSYYKDYSNTYLFKHGDTEDLANKIETLMKESQENREKRRKEIQDHFINSFDVKTLISNLLKLLQK